MTATGFLSKCFTIQISLDITIPTDKECAIVQCNDEFVYYYAVYEDAAWDAWGVLSGVRLRVKMG